ncbi:hypothetical protein [Allochromatium palmeri]|uniref:Uncharacterized protein n=1 Tax=Allochromatium palmeri TaxID=231048 RepID=A0A6N8EHU7_9GAMM|nr:hypothetical protein [Allochromatium palmeri]MTW22618.1 hypothetical protein [Allochromatium palmeri]
MGKLKEQLLEHIQDPAYLESYNDDPSPDQDTDTRNLPDWYLRIIHQTIDEELPF